MTDTAKNQQPTAVASPSTPEDRLGAREAAKVVLQPPRRVGEEGHEWDGLAGAIVTGDERIDSSAPWTVLGGPGTGKTSLLVDTLVHFLAAGGSAEEVMVVTPTKDAATAVNTQLVARLASMSSFAATRTPVRSVHSWAFAALRSMLLASDREAPRLLTGAEHDADVRLLLAGHVEDGAGAWPKHIRPALGYVGFARQLRDLLLRAEERGVGPGELTALGEKYDQPMWVGAGQFLDEYRQTRRLAQSISLNASELLHTTLQEMADGPGRAQLDRWREKLRLILIDDAHNLDPAAAEFLEQFFTPETRVVLAGDPDQCVFHFRGADEELLSKYAADENHRVVLSGSQRFGAPTARAINALTGHLPHVDTRIPLRVAEGAEAAQEAEATAGELVAPDAGRARATSGAAGERNQPIRVLRANSGTAERLHITDALRRAHVRDGVAWQDMAVIVRSVGEIAPIRRALLTHGVPVRVDQTSIILAEQPLIRLLLTALEATYRPLENSEVRVLMESMVGGADPIMVRRLERVLAQALARQRLQGKPVPENTAGLPFQSSDALSTLLNGTASAEDAAEWTAGFNNRELQILQDMSDVLTAGREAQRAGQSVEMVLWEIWKATGLDTRLQERALRGGTFGSQADQDLDSVMMLFDMAGDFVERHPNASIRTFCEEVRAQELPTGGRERGVASNAVEILPAHAAVGRQWHTVVVTRVQEGSWPAGPTVGGLFGQLELVDLLDRGIEPGTRVSRVASAVHEERRLFLVAISRATRSTLVTCIDNASVENGVPSRFVEEITDAPGAAVPLGTVDQIEQEDPVGQEATPGEPVQGELGLGLELGDSAQQGGPAVQASPAEQLSSSDQLSPAEQLSALPRVLALEPLIAELRDVVTDPTQRHHRRVSAARNLAAMAEAGIFGSHPVDWWGMAEPTTMERVTDRRGGVSLSPSKLDNIDNCALKTFFDDNRGAQEETNPMRVGTVVHAIAQAIVQQDLSLEDAQYAARTALKWAVVGPAFEVNAALERWEQGIANLHSWITETCTQTEGTEWEVEQQLDTTLGTLPTGEEVFLRGRIDLMATDADGRVVVYDFKTGKTPKTAAEAQASRQLGAYQFLVHVNRGKQAYGAHLIYPATSEGKLKKSSQPDFSPEQLAETRQNLLAAAEQISEPVQIATPGDAQCKYCSYHLICPAKDAGKTVVSS
ncbi:ATP-dependent DNA helicase [Corynebacterium urealyticum]|uniref:ATP-dependent DNA helicase n=1 Tax=Corynebacterium urealyticum TaxID=43771 RepID=UPI0002B3F405|nr:ATP-dependent DNA helicase [Corynebacterium urealyticum]AGE36089.1 putative ATP-dependent DNA helicase II [Corynebacterium urealyticum DSM 7111]QQB07772.1 ATP-dependent helicase [Corynebacterium urealyticum]